MCSVNNTKTHTAKYFEVTECDIYFYHYTGRKTG